MKTYPVAALFCLFTVPVVAHPEKEAALAHGAPWQAEIYSNFQGFTAEELAQRNQWELALRCGGTLIALNWVLTAAHCIDQAKVNKGYRVRLGARNLALAAGATYRIDRMVRHAGYDKKRHLNDIALVHFVADAETDERNLGKASTIRLYGGPVLGTGVEVTATGWGKVAPGATGRSSVQLLQVDIATVPCEPGYRGQTTEAMLCAAAPGRDTCQGDSGGPLIRTWGEPVLVGIVSWGDGCGYAEKPGVYVRIDGTHYVGWIKRAMTADPSVNSLR